MTTTQASPFYRSPEPQLLADRAQTTTWHGTCPLCPWPITPGQRIAHADGTGWAHVACIARLGKAT